MKGHRYLTGLCLATSLVILLATSVYARIPEPDNIIYGELPPGVNFVALEIDSQQVAAYTRGDNPNAGDFFVLRVPMDAVDPREPGSARPGESGDIFLDGELDPVTTVSIGERGQVQQIFLITIEDDDLDGVPNDVDNCPDEANPDQADYEGDGIGDVCDDSDGDGMMDDYELRLGLAVGSNDATGDADGDLVSNLDEMLLGTNPVLMCGDVSDDTWIELDDAINSLQVLSGVTVTPLTKGGDCDGDTKIGMVEALSILKEVSSN